MNQFRILCLSLGFLMTFQVSALAQWNIETISNGTDTYSSISVALDSSDNIYITYADQTNSMIKSTTNMTGSWVVDTIDTRGGLYTSTAVDSTDYVHVSYAGYGGLKYASNVSGNWVNEVLPDADTGWNLYNSLAIDSSDNVHIGYQYVNFSCPWCSDYQSDLKHATNASGTWDIETIAVYGGEYSEISMAADSSDNLHFGYFNYDQAKYTTNSSGSWTFEVVDPQSDLFNEASMEVDSLGSAHMIYYGMGIDAGLKYATNSSGSWIIDTVDSLIDFSGYSISMSMALDSSNNAHIIYYDLFNEARKYASNSSGTWVIETLESVPLSSYIDESTIVLDSSDNVHFFYTNSSGIQHLTNAPLVPEPISSILFITGGTLLAGRRYIKRRKKA